MINKIKVTNDLGETLVIEARFPEKSGFLLRNADGLTPTKANINISESPTKDGADINSSRLTSRNIILQLDFLEKPTIEATRLRSYRFFPTEKDIKMEVETDNLVVQTSGRVESNDPNIFSKTEGTSISILCPSAFLESKDIQVTEFSGIESAFEFPFENASLVSNEINMGGLVIFTRNSVYYEGGAPTGIMIYIHATGPVSNLVIVNERTQKLLKIDDNKLIAITGSAIVEDDDIVISTIKGDKYITLIRDGEEINIRNALGINVNWFQIDSGDNIFYYLADDGLDNLRFRIENKVLHKGV